MKKFIGLVFAFVIVFAMVGCGNGNGDDEQTQYEQSEVGVDAAYVRGFVAEFAVLMSHQISMTIEMWNYWADHLNSRYQRHGERLHHVPPDWFDEIYVNEFIYRIAAEKVQGFAIDSDFERSFVLLLDSFGSFNHVIRDIAEMEVCEDTRFLSFLRDIATHDSLLSYVARFHLLYDELGGQLPAKSVLHTRVNIMTMLGEFDDFRAEVLARYNFNFDFDHGFEVPSQHYYYEVIFTLPENGIDWLEDLTNLLIIQLYALPASLISTYNIEAGRLIIGPNFNYYLENSFFTTNLTFWQLVVVSEGGPELFPREHVLWGVQESLAYARWQLREHMDNLVTGSINFSAFQSEMANTIDDINSIISALRVLAPDLNLIRIDDEMISNYQRIRAEIMERLDMPFDLSDNELIISLEEAVELSELIKSMFGPEFDTSLLL